MPGFVGQVGQAVDSGAVRRAADAHGIQTSCEVRLVIADDWCVLMAVVRAGDRLTVARDDRRGRLLSVLGGPVWVDEKATTLPDAAGLLARMSDNEDLPTAELEGSYSLVLVRTTSRSVHVVSDHLGSRHVYWTTAKNRLGLGPTPGSAAALAGIVPKLSAQGAAGFLAVGYPLGGHTLLEGVCRLRPAEQLHVSLGDAEPKLTRWWDLHFPSPNRTGLGAATEQFHAEVLSAHRVILSDEPEAMQIALTGGYDSRLMVGALAELGKLPGGTFTWAATAGLKGSDPAVAATVASLVGLRHKVLLFRPEEILRHFDAWCRASGLMSDNLGTFAGGVDFLERNEIRVANVLVGDQLFGPSGTFADRDSAISACLGVPWSRLSGALGGVLSDTGRKEIHESVRAQTESILGSCDSPDLKDVHHYLSFHTGVFGWLLAAGCYKEPAVQARRPLLTRRLFDTVTGWPVALRVDKRVAVEVLRTRYPKLYRIPKAHASALVDWGQAIRRIPELASGLGALLRGEALREGPLRSVIAFDRVRARYEALRVSSGAPGWQQHQRWEWAFDLRRRLSGVAAFRPLLRAGESSLRRYLRPPRRNCSTRVIIRVALLERYAENLEGGR
jgi:hypothetical protein